MFYMMWRHEDRVDSMCRKRLHERVDPKEVKLDSMFGNAATNIVDPSDRKSS